MSHNNNKTQKNIIKNSLVYKIQCKNKVTRNEM